MLKTSEVKNFKRQNPLLKKMIFYVFFLCFRRPHQYFLLSFSLVKQKQQNPKNWIGIGIETYNIMLLKSEGTKKK